MKRFLCIQNTKKMSNLAKNVEFFSKLLNNFANLQRMGFD